MTMMLPGDDGVSCLLSRLGRLMFGI